MFNENIEQILANAAGKNIAVIGDLMLDRYLLGEVNRISPEAPVQVFDIKTSEYRLGGAANVGYNIKMLGAEPFLIGVIGNDREAEMLKNVLKEQGQKTDGLVEQYDRPTTTKTRVIAAAHHLLRIDSESKDKITKETEERILEIIKKNLKNFDAIILQDYNKGVLSKNIITQSIQLANSAGIPVLVDPKFNNFFEFKNTFLFKPNRKELEDAMGRKAEDIEMLKEMAEEIADKLKCEYLVLTLGEQGMMIFRNEDGKTSIDVMPTHARKVADVSGAGDTVISTLAVCIAAGSGIKDAVRLSNLAAGLVVEEVGIVPVSKSKLIEHIKTMETA